MANSDATSGLKGAADAAGLAAQVAAPAGKRGGPETWNPPFCGDIDMRIARDGTWFYLGTPIGRLPLVKLFARVLRRDEDGKYLLVTPVEKVGIKVDDAPFAAVECRVAGAGRDQVLTFRTNVDDEVEAGAGHPIRVATDPATLEPAPYVHVRGGLEALIVRAVFYDLVEMAETVARPEGRRELMLWSGGAAFSLGFLDDA